MYLKCIIAEPVIEKGMAMPKLFDDTADLPLHSDTRDPEKLQAVLAKVEHVARQYHYTHVQRDERLFPSRVNSLIRCASEAKTAFKAKDYEATFESLYGAGLAYQAITAPMPDIGYK